MQKRTRSQPKALGRNIHKSICRHRHLTSKMDRRCEVSDHFLFLLRLIFPVVRAVEPQYGPWWYLEFLPVQWSTRCFCQSLSPGYVSTGLLLIQVTETTPCTWLSYLGITQWRSFLVDPSCIFSDASEYYLQLDTSPTIECKEICRTCKENPWIPPPKVKSACFGPVGLLFYYSC